jgi:uncharacterized protein YjbJ (UPF0337 family)
MNEDQVKGKAKDIAGRVERQVGEWTGDSDKQVHGTAKQAHGKVQNAWGNVKEAAKNAADQAEKDRTEQKRLKRPRDINRRKAS